jgi:site-specific DNA recombinase
LTLDTPESRHIDEGVLFQAFINAFNAVVENKGYFMEKWQQVLESEDDILKKVTAKRFIQIFSKAKLIDHFEVDLYFKLVEKIVVYDGGRLVFSLLDGLEIEGEIE